MGSLLTADLFVGKLVRLSAPRPEDYEKLATWSHDPEYLRQLDFNAARPRSTNYFTPSDKDKEREEIREQRSFEFYLRTIAEDKFIGFVELWVMWNHQNAWIGIGVGDPEYRGKGYGTEAMSLALGYAFRELNLYRVQLGVFGYNKRAIRSYEKNGFVHEGAQRSLLYRDGQRHDVLLMGILRSEWEARQAELLSQRQSGEG
jgi:RimJ/RimL family protein N-acetyltransferase